MNLTDALQAVVLEHDGAGRAVVHCQPVDVARSLGKLFDRARCVLTTSDTLAVGGRFEAIRAELGIPEIARVLEPLPARASATRILVVVPERVPDPTERDWPIAVTCRFIDIQNATDGRACAFFTSDEVIEHVQNHIRYLGARIRRSSLEGPALVDLVPGDEATASRAANYKCLIIDRLPFPHSDSPVLQVIKEWQASWFVWFALPRAVLAFRQALAILIRSAPKRAVVVVLDQRVLSRPYGRLFLSCFSNLTVSRRLDDIPLFLSGKEITR